MPIVIWQLAAILSSCELGPEQWEPHVLTARFAKNGTVEQLNLKTGPTIVIDEGDNLEFIDFSLQLLPTRRSKLVVIRNKEVQPVPASALNIKARVSATIRRQDESGHCYDKRSQLFSDWIPVHSEEWEVNMPSRSLIVRQDWDEIRIDIQIHRQDRRDPEAQYTTNSIILEPTHTFGRLNRHIEHNIFMRLYDSVRGDRFCSE